MSKPQFLVKEIVVEASHKAWAQGSVVRGDSGGSSFTWTVTPPDGHPGWSEREATEVTLRVRRQIQAIQVADSQARGAPEPDAGADSLRGFDAAINAVATNGKPSAELEPELAPV
jgi:hypothetical protein